MHSTLTLVLIRHFCMECCFRDVVYACAYEIFTVISGMASILGNCNVKINILLGHVSYLAGFNIS